jgi:hypothetical protein
MVSREYAETTERKGYTVYEKLFSTSTHPTRERDWNNVMRRVEIQRKSCFCDVEKVMMIDEVLQYSLVV